MQRHDVDTLNLTDVQGNSKHDPHFDDPTQPKLVRATAHVRRIGVPATAPPRRAAIGSRRGAAIPNPIVSTHLVDVLDERLCCVQDGPTAPAPILLDGNCNEDMVFCGSRARAALIPIIQSIQARCDAAPILVNTRTPLSTALGLVVSVRGLCCLRGRGASRRTKPLLTRA